MHLGSLLDSWDPCGKAKPTYVHHIIRWVEAQLRILELEPVIRMSHENISVEEFYCKFAPVVWILFWFWNCMTECSKHIGWHSTWALWDKQKYVNINSLIGANLQFLKNNRNVLVTHSYNWLYPKLDFFCKNANFQYFIRQSLIWPHPNSAHTVKRNILAKIDFENTLLWNMKKVQNFNVIRAIESFQPLPN